MRSAALVSLSPMTLRAPGAVMCMQALVATRLGPIARVVLECECLTTPRPPILI
jgi:hypothetical protein